MWTVEVRHDGLNKFKVVRGETREIAELKAALQMRSWEERWAQVVHARERTAQKAQLSWMRESKKQQAQEQSEAAILELAKLETILRDGLEIDPAVDWSSLKDSTPFPKKRPQKPEPIQ